MMKKIYSLIFSACLLIICSSCGGGGDDGGGEPEPIPIAAPEAATLIFPENNTECNISEVLSETQSIVPFEWNASENTDTYQLLITNLNTNFPVTAPIVTVPEANVTLERGTPYEWQVVSRANGTNETATSATFRFFNEGPGIENYAPFPASASNPNPGTNLDSSTTTVTLEWTANDIDNDITGFDVFLGTDAASLELLSNTTTASAETPVSSGTTYFWRVITRDGANNSSQSEVFQFRVLN